MNSLAIPGVTCSIKIVFAHKLVISDISNALRHSGSILFDGSVHVASIDGGYASGSGINADDQDFLGSTIVEVFAKVIKRT